MKLDELLEQLTAVKDVLAMNAVKDNTKPDNPEVVFGRTINCLYYIDGIMLTNNAITLLAMDAGGDWGEKQEQAARVADRLLLMNGVNQLATLLTPSNADGEAGPYNRQDIIEAILPVL